MKDGSKNATGQGENSDKQEEVSEGRRKTVAKLVYASPVMAGLVFSQRAAAISPPPPPPPPG